MPKRRSTGPRKRFEIDDHVEPFDLATVHYVRATFYCEMERLSKRRSSRARRRLCLSYTATSGVSVARLAEAGSFIGGPLCRSASDFEAVRWTHAR